MTGWIIFGSILFVIVFLFTRSVTVTAVYDKNPEITAKYLFLKLFRLPAKPKKKKNTKEAEKKPEEEKSKPEEEISKEENSEKDNEAPREDAAEEAPKKSAAAKVKKAATGSEKPKKGFSLSDISLEMIKDYVESASPPIKRLFKKIKVRDLYIDYVVGSDDAAKTAIKYGSLCALIYS